MSDIFALWRKAMTTAVLRVEDGAVSAAEEVGQIGLNDGGDAIIYVKVIRFDQAKLHAEPETGGLLAAL